MTFFVAITTASRPCGLAVTRPTFRPASHHRWPLRLDLDLCRLAAPVRSDHGQCQRRDEVARHGRADLLDIAAAAMMRDADRAVCTDGDEMERRIDAAALDEVGDESGEAFRIVR